MSTTDAKKNQIPSSQTNNKKEKKNKVQSVSVHPYQILHPSIFPNNNNNDKDYNFESVPLVRAIPLLLQSLQTLQRNPSLIQKLYDNNNKNDETNSKHSDETTTTTTKKEADDDNNDDDTTNIIQLSLSISHTIDPLTYLHSQSSILYHQYPHIPTLYFSNIEGTTETCMIGSSLTFDSLISSSSSSDDGNGNENNHWNIIQNLPTNSRFYGGSRFDVESSSSDSSNNTIIISEEWKQFKRELWMLPLFELRRSSSSSASSSSSSSSTTQVLLHIVKQSSSSTFQTSIQKAINTLSSFQTQSITSKPKPPTTIPPVLYRSDDTTGAFECAVEQALSDFETTIENEEGHNEEEEEQQLEKVVLARKCILSLGSSSPFLGGGTTTTTAGLDLLMKLKFSGHVGHFIYLHPPGNDDGNGLQRIQRSEFFGCAPERLFQISSSTTTTTTSSASSSSSSKPTTTTTIQVSSEALA
eukprot:15365208-Ditylum_brightwellii.AAC.1